MSRRANIWGNYSATVLGITLALFMLGMLLCIEYHTYRLTYNAQERITYKIDLSPETSDSTAIAIKGRVEGMPLVKNVDYISKEQAAEIFTEDLGEDFVGFIGYNPLYPSLMVNFRADLIPAEDKSEIERFCREVKREECVTGVAYQENVVEELREIFYKATWFLIVFVALLLIVTVVLIGSLIRVAIYSQRETIHTMRLVGASIGFIARPFLWRSVLYGAVGGLLASVLTTIALWVFGNEFGVDIIATQHWIWYGIIMAILVMVGVVIAAISTALTIRRYVD